MVGMGRIAREISATDITSIIDEAADLIRLLPLDGGHIICARCESVRRFFAKRLRRPDPGQVDIAKMLPLTYVVAVAMMLMGAVLIYADIVKPVNLFG